MRTPTVEEVWAKNCGAAALGVQVRVHDDGSRPRMYDLTIKYPDGRFGAVEVTSAADAESIEMWNVTAGGDRAWREPTLSGVWQVGAVPRTRVKLVRDQLSRTLRRFEQREIQELRPARFRQGGLLPPGVTRVTRIGSRSPGQIRMHPDPPSERSWGWFPETGEPLIRWLEDWVGSPDQTDNRLKLARASAQERHLLVVVPPFSTVPFEATELLVRSDIPLPTRPPVLPPEISHVWTMSKWDAGHGLRWSPDGGWALFNKTVGLESFD